MAACFVCRRSFAVLLILGLLALGGTSGADDGIPTCLGETPTIVGTAGKDKLSGTPGADVIKGLAGNDTIDGRGGNDMICGDAGDDRLSGGRGDDTLADQSSTFDQDRLTGGRGNDRLFGDLGDDLLVGGSGNDELSGGDGDDEYLNPGKDELKGGPGEDNLRGGPGEDVLSGGRGNDALDGGGEADQLLGEAGNDQAFGSDGDDELRGGRGDDFLDGETGDDRVLGEADNDQLRGNDGDDDLHGGAGGDDLDGVLGDDRLYGEAGSDQLAGGFGDDLLDGGAGDDRLFGGVGDDELLGGPGDDLLDGGPGVDEADGGPGDDQVVPEPTLASLIDSGDRDGLRTWALDRSIATLNSEVAALDQAHRDRLAEVVLDTNATGESRDKMLRVIRTVLADHDLGFYAEIWSYTFVELTGGGFFGTCNHLFLSPDAWAGLSDQDALSVLMHESLHSFNCVNGGPIGSLDEGSAIWIVKVNFGGEPKPGESWAEATYGTKLYYRDLQNNPDFPLTAPLAPTSKLLEVYGFLAAHDPSQLPWNSTERLVTCFDRYFVDLNRDVPFDTVWLPAVAERTELMLADSECKPL